MSKLPTLLGPLIFLVFYIALFIVIRGTIPDPSTLIENIKNLYGSYGYLIIFFGSFLEALFIIGLYLPGATVVLLGAALSKTGVIEFPLVYLLSNIGLCMGYSINYILGKYGWYHVLNRFGLGRGIDTAKNNLVKHKRKAIFIGFIHPSSASFLSTAAGVTGFQFREFFILAVLSQAFWSLVWGSLAYFFGLPLVEFFLKYYSLVILAIIAIWIGKKILKI